LTASQLELPLPVPRPQAGVTGESIRAVQLGRRIVTYRFRRAARRTIGISVGREGLSASAPRWVTIAEVESFIREKADWVMAKLAEASTVVRSRIDWRPGVKVQILGRDTTLTFAADAANAGLEGDVLALAPVTEADGGLRVALVDWMKRDGLDLFARRAAIYAPRLDVALPEVRISNARTQWGHCTIGLAGRVRVFLNWRLMQFTERLIDYVVVHELSHIREMNHSRRFWDLVATQCPDYRASRLEIHTLSRQLPDL